MLRASERWVLTIADDLTGALEAGAKFAAHGISSRITTDTDLSGAPDVQVLVIDAETRHLSKEAAGGLVRRIAKQAWHLDPWLIYKKTDSTLRGHIAAELQGLVDAFPERKLIYVPAYPEMGRTVRDGQLFVHGIPVHESPFGSDALNPVCESEIVKLLDGVPVTILQGETSADVRESARLILDMHPLPLVAGPAAIAEELARCLPLARSDPPELPAIAKALVVNGSRHPRAGEQIAWAQVQSCFADGWQLFAGNSLESGRKRARTTGEQVRGLLELSPLEVLVVFGGDTAFGIHQALGSQPFEALGEILPGVPLSRSGSLFWITKAGGFGEPGILCDIRKRLT